MTGRYARHSKVMTISNRLVKQGYNRANAMVKAWALVKMPQLLTKVSGVPYNQRPRPPPTRSIISLPRSANRAPQNSKQHKSSVTLHPIPPLKSLV